MKLIHTLKKIKIESIYAILMFFIFLFFFHNYYFDITYAKYSFFKWTTCIIGITYVLVTAFRQKNDRKELFHLTITDVCMFIWLIIQTISLLISDYKAEAWSGSLGRNTGLLFYLLCFLGYFILSRSQINRKNLIHLFLTGTALLNILAVCNFFSIDPFGFFIKLSDYQSNFFLSTSGNINFYASIICLSLPISCYLFLCEEKNIFFYLTVSIIGFFGLLSGNSDGGYLGIGFMFLFLFWYSCKKTEYLKRLLILGFCFLTTAKILFILSSLTPIASRPFITLSDFFVNSTLTWGLWVMLCLALVYLLLHEQTIKTFLPIIQKGVLTLYLSLFIIVTILFIYFSFINKTAEIGFLSSYLRWNDSWGTGRAYAWRNLIEAFSDFSIPQKLFGYGPDTTRCIMMKYYMQNSYLIQFNNAHNEYIQYLVTTGILGLLSYISIWAANIYCIMKNKLKVSLYTKAISLAIIIYLIQAAVNINQPISTPLLFLLLGVSQIELRKNRK